MNLLFEKEAPLHPLKGATIAVMGFGNQGHAHALNLRDSGLKILVASRPDTAGARLARKWGFEPIAFAEAARAADLIVFGIADEAQPEVYDAHVAPHLRAGQCLGFIHGFNIHFDIIHPPRDVDVVMVAPKGPGHALRRHFETGGGLPCLAAVHQDATGRARSIALAWATGIGSGRAGIMQTTFAEECVTDLFGEQAVLCGGLVALMQAGVETLIDAGYSAEMAYFECVHEVKLIVDLVYEGGIDYMRRRISNTAEYGGLTRGPRIIDEHVRRNMKQLLAEIQRGDFAREWRAEYRAGLGRFRQLAQDETRHPAEAAGATLRALMPWLEPRRLHADGPAARK
jgi:ketol-acid reductoisomerase